MSKKKQLHKKYKESFSEYKSLFKILKKRKLRKKDFYLNNQGDVLSTASLLAKKIDVYIRFYKSNLRYRFMDVGCGLGIITNEIAKINGYQNTFACEPSVYAAKFIKKFFPKVNFIDGGIEDIGKKFYNFFDVLYLKEVSPFRSSDIIIQKKLIKKMKLLLRKDGIIILEQIKNKGKLDIYSNLNRLKLNHKIVPTVPNFILKGKNKNLLYKYYKLINFFLASLDKIYFKFLKKKTYYIIINKF